MYVCGKFWSLSNNFQSSYPIETDADLIIKNSVIEILQLPGDIPDNMLYQLKNAPIVA